MQNSSQTVYNMNPILLTPSTNLSVQSDDSGGLALIVNGTGRHYSFSYGRYPGHQNARTEDFRFYLDSGLAADLLARLSDPSSDSTLVNRLVESASARKYGYMGRNDGFSNEVFDRVPGWETAGFKVLQDGDRTLLYLCNADISDASAEISEALVQLDPQARSAHLEAMQSLLHSRATILESNPV